MIQAGIAKVCITPPVGCLMDGYGDRTHGAEGIHDDLFARALVLDDGVVKMALVSVEIVGLRGDSIAAIRERVKASTGIPGSHLYISAVHTHSGPTCRYGDDELSNRNLAATEDKIAGAVMMANTQLTPAQVEFGRAPVQCGVNRRELRNGRIVLGVNPTGPTYPWVDFLHVMDAAGNTLAVWFCHPVHAVVMGPSNYLISGDLPGAAARFIERNCGGVALFANGCCGNINSFPHNTTFADVEKLGRRLGAAVVKGLTEIEAPAVCDGALFGLQHAFLLPIEELPRLEVARQDVREKEQALKNANGAGELFWRGLELQRAHDRLKLAEAGEQPQGLPAAAHVVVIADTALVGLPFEVFIELADAIQADSPFARTIVNGYTNGYLGYMPTREAFAEGGYEVEPGRARYQGLAITADAGEVLVRECSAALRRVYSECRQGK
jgi:neutral ceramidase